MRMCHVSGHDRRRDARSSLEHRRRASTAPRQRLRSPTVARILIVAGGCRGRRLARELVAQGHAVRVTTRLETGRAAIESTGAECWIGTPERLGTLRAALESVTIVCWLLGTVAGSEDEIRALHTSRLEFFLGQVIDTTVRGFVYEAAGSVSGDVLVEGEQIVQRIAERNVIPMALLRVEDSEAWQSEARAVVDKLLGGSPV
jgi:hypothetical protein